eukprot:5839837-Pyramimonas_sp.AAC.1
MSRQSSTTTTTNNERVENAKRSNPQKQAGGEWNSSAPGVHRGAGGGPGELDVRTAAAGVAKTGGESAAEAERAGVPSRHVPRAPPRLRDRPQGTGLGDHHAEPAHEEGRGGVGEEKHRRVHCGLRPHMSSRWRAPIARGKRAYTRHWNQSREGAVGCARL